MDHSVCIITHLPSVGASNDIQSNKFTITASGDRHITANIAVSGRGIQHRIFEATLQLKGEAEYGTQELT